MGNLTDNEKKLIDIYYDEQADEVIPDKSFQEKLITTVSQMSLPKDNEDNIPNNFFDIINNAEEIKTKKLLLNETILFVLAASFILVILAVLILLLGEKFLLIIQSIIFLVLPLTLIPFAINARNRGRSK